MNLEGKEASEPHAQMLKTEFHGESTCDFIELIF